MGHGMAEGHCKLSKTFYKNSAIWELNRISKKNPHLSLIKKMLQELSDEELPTLNAKKFIDGNLKKSQLDKVSQVTLNKFLWEFYKCYKDALMGCDIFKDDSDLHYQEEEFCKIILGGYATRNRQPSTHNKLWKKQEGMLLEKQLDRLVDGVASGTSTARTSFENLDGHSGDMDDDERGQFFA